MLFLINYFTTKLFFRVTRILTKIIKSKHQTLKAHGTRKLYLEIFYTFGKQKSGEKKTFPFLVFSIVFFILNFGLWFSNEIKFLSILILF